MNFTSITGIASDSTVAKDLGVRAIFLAHVAPLYPNHLADFPKKSPICSIALQDCSLRGFASTSPRLSLYSLISSIKRMNQKHKNEAKNQPLQSVMFKMLQEEDEAQAKKVLVTLCELYRRKVWFDDRTANAICTASFHPASELDLRAQNRHSLAYSPADRGHFKITSFDASPDSSDLIFLGGSDRFGQLYDRRMLRLGCTR